MATKTATKTYVVTFHMIGGDKVRVHTNAASRDEAKELASREHHIPANHKTTASVLK